MSNGAEERELLLPIPSRGAGQDSIFRVSRQYDHRQDISIIYQSGPRPLSVRHGTETLAPWPPCDPGGLFHNRYGLALVS